MSNARNEVRKRWISIIAVLTIMVGAGSFAIVPNTGQPTVDELGKKAIVLGDASTGFSNGFTTNSVMWSEDCQLSQSPSVFTVVQFDCTKHTAVMKITGTKGDRTEFTIKSLKCLASDDDHSAIIRAHVGKGVLLDMLEASDIHNVRLTDRPNEWIVQIANCDTDPALTTNENDFIFDLVLIDTGNFEFDFSTEEL